MTAGAAAELFRLFDAEVARDLASARRLRAAMAGAFETLERMPFSARAARLARRTTLRELLVPYGRWGYLALLEIDQSVVTVLKLRQREAGDG
ncbi:MAG: type II toxin-antitoxin system RelE/ParE family toxin [Myxococcales bacterium]|nr:type II toxin-antitoxin system RelE/ParE family toxin [Myxococcales bacterium]